MKKRRNYLLESCLLFVSILIGAYPVSSQIPNSINYNESNGLPSNESYFVLQDQEGFIWISTDNGVVRFDGLNFKLYNKQNGLADNVNFSIHSDSRHRLLFRSFSGGLTIFQDDSMYKHPLNRKIQEILGKSTMSSLVVDKSDGIHIGMSSTGRILDIDATGHFTEHQIPEFSMAIESKGGDDPLIVFRDTPGKLRNLIVNGVVQNFMPYDGSDNMGVVGAKVVLGKTFFFNDKYLFEVGKVSNKMILRTDHPIVSLSIDRANRLWIGLQSGGVICYENEKFTVPSYFSALEKLTVTSLVQDNNKGFWLSTLERGVFYFPDLSILNYPLPSYSKVSAVAFSEAGAYFGNYDGSLYKFSPEDHSFQIVKEFRSPITGLFYNSKEGNLFISFVSGTSILDITSGKYFSESKIPIRGMRKFQEHDSKIFGGNFMGLYTFDFDGTCSSFTITPFRIRNLLLTETDYFFAPVSGLVKANAALTKFDTLLKFDDNKVLDLKASPNGLLIATSESGLLRIVDDTVLPYFTNNVFSCPRVGEILLDQKYIYLATQCGLIIDELSKINTNRSLQIINTGSGLSSPNIDYLGFVDNNLLCFSSDAISVINTSHLSRTGNDIKFYLKDILINNSKVSSINEVLTFEENNLEFQYGFISFNDRNIKVQHRLAPSFRWSEGEVSKVNYYSLGPGYYEPAIQYSVNGGPWQEVSLTRGFRISPPWWESAYFQFVALLLISSTIGLIFYSVYQQKIAQVKYQEGLRREKDRISRELHDNIGSRLASIKLSIYDLNHENNFPMKKEMIENQLTSTVHELRDTIWAINTNTISVQEFANRVKNWIAGVDLPSIPITFTFESEKNGFNHRLNPGLALNLYRIIQEALNNSIKHSRAKAISVVVKLNGQKSLSISVKDDGEGFYPKAMNNMESYGLQSMKVRAEELKAYLEIESNPENGTEIKVTCALN